MLQFTAKTLTKPKSSLDPSLSLCDALREASRSLLAALKAAYHTEIDDATDEVNPWFCADLYRTLTFTYYPDRFVVTTFEGVTLISTVYAEYDEHLVLSWLSRRSTSHGQAPILH